VTPETPDALYAALATSDPDEKVRIVLRVLEENPGCRFELPARNGLRATLDGIDLSRDLLRRGEGVPTSSWWSEDRQGVILVHADLRGASFRGARLHGVLLEEADLADADLAGADLRGADLSGATLQRALLEGSDLRKTVLRFARAARSILEHAKLQGADLWGADLEGAELSGAKLQAATLEEANLQNADLAGADLRHAILKRANLQGANLRGADLRGAIVGGTNLDGALLRNANLEELDLTPCSLTHVHTSGARLEKTRLEQEQLGNAIGEEVSREYGLARKGYLVLERNFDELGDHDAARWAYGRRRRMEKRQALVQARAAWSARRWAVAVQSALKYAGDQIVEWVCDYGESVWRVLGTLIVVYVVFTAIYGLTGAVVRVETAPAGKVESPTRNLVDLAIFSLAAMTASGNAPDDLAFRSASAYALAGIHTLISIFLTGLMGFVAGNRIRR
jgi:uncharacterized protein YjbI with pentapeptide repeats